MTLSKAIDTHADLEDVERELRESLTEGDLAEVPALSAKQKELSERLHQLLSDLPK